MFNALAILLFNVSANATYCLLFQGWHKLMAELLLPRGRDLGRVARAAVDAAALIDFHGPGGNPVSDGCAGGASASGQLALRCSMVKDVDVLRLGNVFLC